jgi:hypothetical protein
MTAQVELIIQAKHKYLFYINARRSEETVAFLDIKISCPPGQSRYMASTPITVTVGKRTNPVATVDGLSIEEKHSSSMASNMQVRVYSH